MLVQLARQIVTANDLEQLIPLAGSHGLEFFAGLGAAFQGPAEQGNTRLVIVEPSQAFAMAFKKVNELLGGRVAMGQRSLPHGVVSRPGCEEAWAERYGLWRLTGEFCKRECVVGVWAVLTSRKRGARQVLPPSPLRGESPCKRPSGGRGPPGLRSEKEQPRAAVPAAPECQGLLPVAMHLVVQIALVSP